ncbi:MAG TPA: RsmB/NOP family class I SAM-dependent RNA methyltransferase [Myxococcaceae bacterium]|nr:RsmB/NOP family class I SAM-dependent RNA methyltransferase [Myxococcaceae bacterium]
MSTPSAPTWPHPHPPELLGKATRKSVVAALEAHVAVSGGTPLRRALSEALGRSRGLGGQERRFTALAVRELSRHLRLLDLALKLLGHPPGKGLLIQDRALLRMGIWRRLFCGAAADKIRAELSLPGPLRPRTVDDSVVAEIVERPLPPFPQQALAVTQMATRHSLPGWLAERLAALLPQEDLDAAFGALNREAPIQLRVRPGVEPEGVRRALAAEDVEVDPVEGLPDAWVVRGVGHRVFETRPMRAGQLQVQDVGSQLIVALCGTPGELEGRGVADLCAGAGGKTLALADRVGRGGRVYAADASARRLADARDRVRRLGLRQVRFEPQVPLGEVTVALIDAPCSGVGSLSREPDVRWSLTPDRVTGLTRLQDRLLEETGRALPSGGVMVYATCSLFREENEARVEAFLSGHPDFCLEPPGARVPERFVTGDVLRVWPHQAPGGGFFAARLRRS